MKIISKILVLAATFAVSTFSTAQTFTSGNLRYQVISNTPGASYCKLLGHVQFSSAASGNLTIPEYVVHGQAYYVTEIADNAFKDYTRLSGSLDIPNTVTKIGKKAFANCGFDGTLVIRSSVVIIDDGAFEGCSDFHGNINLQSGLEKLGDDAFLNCSGFEGILLLPGTLTELGKGAFSGCTGLHGTVSIPANITTVPCGAFKGTAVSAIQFHDNVTAIEQDAFNGCHSLTGNLSLPNSLTSIGSSAFYGCYRLTGSLTIPNSVTVIGEHAFAGCTGFNGSLTLSSSLTEINVGVFVNCSGLSGTLTIPNGVTTIKTNAFKGCSGFSGNLTIPQSVTVIDAGAFEDCSGLNGILTIGRNVGVIKERAFKNCGFTNDVISDAIHAPVLMGTGSGYPFDGVSSNAVRVLFSCGSEYSLSAWHTHFDIVEDTGFTLNDFMYRGYTENTLAVVSHVNGTSASGYATIPGEVVWLGKTFTVTTLDENLLASSNIEGLIMPSTIMDVGANTASNCTNLQWVEIYAGTPPNLGANAFAGIPCNTLLVPNDHVAEYESSPWHDIFPNISPIMVVFEEGNLTYEVTDGQNAMIYGNTYGTYYEGTLTIPETVTHGGKTYTVNEIGFGAFAYHHFTGSLVIPSTITKIGRRAFEYCSNFTGSLTIPSSVKVIESEAFQHCTGFTGNLVMPSTLEVMGYGLFEGCTGFNGTLIISEGVTEIKNNTFKGCTGLHGNLEIPDGVVTIGESAFEDCTGFDGSLILPNTLMEIGDNAFLYCSGLNGGLIIPNSVVSIGSQAFKSTGLSGILTIGSSVKTIGMFTFENCQFTDGIEIFALEPPAIYVDYNPFYAVPNRTLTVPFGLKEVYVASDWNAVCFGIVNAEYINDGEYKYRTSDDNTLTVAEYLNGTASGYKKLAKAVEWLGQLYYVTAVGDNLFKASDISGVVIPRTVTSIGANAFSDCPNLISVEVKATTPPEFGANAFGNIPCYTLTVQCGCTEAYEASPWNNYFLYYIEDCTAVEDVAGKNALNIYPNPTHGILKIEAENIKNIEIYNSIGQKVFETETSGDSFEYNFNGASGMYLMRVETAKGVETKRVIVM